jgi:CheY-specific phosphatase CheX
MFFASVLQVESCPANTQSTPLGVSVAFSGSFSGSLQLWTTSQLAAGIAETFLGGNDAGEGDNEKLMLNELANMICGRTLTELFPDGDFQLDSPVPVSSVPEQTQRGQLIHSDSGSIWVQLDMGYRQWPTEAQFAS